MFSSALCLYEFKFQMVSGYSTLVQFQSGARKFGALHYKNYKNARNNDGRASEVLKSSFIYRLATCLSNGLTGRKGKPLTTGAHSRGE